MPELIDKAKLLEYLAAIKPDEYVSAFGEAAVQVIGLIEEFVKEMPTIEAEPVRHGRWIYGRYDEYPTCSCCKQSDTYAGDYCGNCGTKMDLRTPTEVELDIADSVMMGGADNGNG